MALSTADWIAIGGIVIATIIGIITILKKGEGKNNSGVNVAQKSSFLSKAKQNQNVNVNINND